MPVPRGLPTVDREAALMAALRARYGIGGRVAALVRTGAEAAPVYAYVVRVTHCPDASGLRLAEAGGVREDEEVAAPIRRSGGVRGVLTLPDLREEGEGQGPLTAVAVRAAGLAARAVRDVVASGRRGVQCLLSESEWRCHARVRVRPLYANAATSPKLAIPMGVQRGAAPLKGGLNTP
ncbi:hypothetical protein [Streptomyces sp. NPDC047079]|uniref:hypothetical protein n=1 Tax=Streptomyces sp. NPDC047079 TaxID=3154607 RepID=UPI0033F5C58E